MCNYTQVAKTVLLLVSNSVLVTSQIPDHSRCCYTRFEIQVEFRPKDSLFNWIERGTRTDAA